MSSLKRLETYISSDEASLHRQRAVLAQCEPGTPAYTLAAATVAEYERALRSLYRRRAAMTATADDRPDLGRAGSST
jgi:hypothetical protein